MSALLLMGAAEANLQDAKAGPFIISGFMAPIFGSLDQSQLHL